LTLQVPNYNNNIWIAENDVKLLVSAFSRHIADNFHTAKLDQKENQSGARQFLMLYML